MHHSLHADLDGFSEVLGEAVRLSDRYLDTLSQRHVSRPPLFFPLLDLPEDGMGAAAALRSFEGRYFDGLTASTGSRSFGYVVGGATPAAVAGDWLTSALDQDNGEGVTVHLETEAARMLGQLLGVPEDYFGTFVTGATMANFTSLATGRQWHGRRRGVDVAQDGLVAMGGVRVLSGTPHVTISKAAAMLGLGRSCIAVIPCLPGTEAVDPAALEQALGNGDPRPRIVVGNAGTVHATSFDDFRELGRLKQKYGFWLHIDGAFGLLAACSPRYAHLVEGVSAADSITVDAHKWLNVPYDCGIVFTRHAELQRQVFINANAAYLGEPSSDFDYMNRTPESSRRLRALPVWFTLRAYGRAGYREIVERDCAMAEALGERISASTQFELLCPVTLNVVSFTPRGRPEQARSLVEKLTEDGQVFMTPTVYRGISGIRAALCNWRTEAGDIDLAWQALLRCVA
jgi:glutamate/tyrosine decarboxylase-like PLP-dependent enzyme